MNPKKHNPKNKFKGKPKPKGKPFTRAQADAEPKPTPVKAPAAKPEEPPKPSLHPRNLHRGHYDFDQLTASSPELADFVKPNKYNHLSVDFADPAAVKALNKALLLHHYKLESWDIPTGYLCPPIPGRADYLHHAADILGNNNYGNAPKGPKITCLDIGTGANLVYPIIGTHAYNWNFVGSEIDDEALASAQQIIDGNSRLKGKIELRKQENSKQILQGIMQKDEKFDLVICNPPFHASAKEAETESLRKFRNLRDRLAKNAVLNFGGKPHELWREGGERKFVIDLVNESKEFSDSCLWFTTLISKEANVKHIKHALQQVKPNKVKVIKMGTANKQSRLVAWTFMTIPQEEAWIKVKW